MNQVMDGLVKAENMNMFIDFKDGYAEEIIELMENN